MGRKISTAGSKTKIIQFTGIFDLDGLYKATVGWIKSRRYWFHEDVYKHKPGGPFGKELEIKWRADKKLNDFYSTGLDVKWHIWDLKDVEVIKNGKKVKLQKARVEIKLDTWLQLEHQKKWGQNKFTKALYEFFENYIIKKEWSSIWWDTSYYRLMKFQAFIKNYLDMQTKGNEYAGYLGDS